MVSDVREFMEKKKGRYRALAREHLVLAKTQLETESDENLYYAALEIRKVLEALIYQIAGNYTNDLPKSDLGIWQPAKLLNVLLKIDPMADRSGEIRVARESADPDHVPQWRSLGEDRRVTLAEIKRNYDALGAYLHTPTAVQLLENKGHDTKKLRIRLDKLAVRLEEILSAKVHNFIMKSTSSFDCAECGSRITRNVAALKGGIREDECDELIVECFDCDASYRLTAGAGDEIIMVEELADIKCPVENCGHIIHVWKRRATLGFRVQCSECDSVLQIAMGILIEEEHPINKSVE